LPKGTARSPGSGARAPQIAWSDLMTNKLLRGAAFAATLALAVGAAPAAMAANWQSLTSNEGGFTVLMPTGYVNENQPVDMGGGRPKASNVSYRVESDGAYWGVSATDYPQAATRDPQQMLTNARDGALKRWNGTIHSDTAITVGGKPAREVVYNVIDDGNTYTVRQRFILITPQRVVQQAYVGQNGTEHTPQADRFFASLKLK
jgi:hypothetical protein